MLLAMQQLELLLSVKRECQNGVEVAQQEKPSFPSPGVQ